MCRYRAARSQPEKASPNQVFNAGLGCQQPPDLHVRMPPVDGEILSPNGLKLRRYGLEFRVLSQLNHS